MRYHHRKHKNGLSQQVSPRSSLRVVGGACSLASESARESVYGCNPLPLVQEELAMQLLEALGPPRAVILRDIVTIYLPEALKPGAGRLQY